MPWSIFDILTVQTKAEFTSVCFVWLVFNKVCFCTGEKFKEHEIGDRNIVQLCDIVSMEILCSVPNLEGTLLNRKCKVLTDLMAAVCTLALHFMLNCINPSNHINKFRRPRLEWDDSITINKNKSIMHHCRKSSLNQISIKFIRNVFYEPSQPYRSRLSVYTYSNDCS